jgi:predicted DNA-binding transcriptional regulator YafY
MPKNKAQLLRIKGIDDRLNRWSRVKQKRLAKIFEVTERQIGRDIKYMKDEFNAPITHDNEGYFYTENFSIPLNLSLTGEEIRQLKLAVKTLNQYQHLDAFADLGGLIDKIESSVRFKLPDIKHNFIHFEKVPFYQGTELLEFFIDAIERTQTVTFDYQSFKSEYPINHIIHPYILKEHTNRWYVIGFLPAQNSITSFALERIIQNEGFKFIPSHFDVHPEFNATTFFENTFGMTVYANKPIEKIILSFTPLQGKYFESKPFHKYKIIEKNAEQLTVEMHLIPNLELIRKLVSFGSGVEVIAPTRLKESLLRYLNEAMIKYQ